MERPNPTRICPVGTVDDKPRRQAVRSLVEKLLQQRAPAIMAVGRNRVVAVVANLYPRAVFGRTGRAACRCRSRPRLVRHPGNVYDFKPQHLISSTALGVAACVIRFTLIANHKFNASFKSSSVSQYRGGPPGRSRYPFSILSIRRWALLSNWFLVALSTTDRSCYDSGVNTDFRHFFAP